MTVLKFLPLLVAGAMCLSGCVSPQGDGVQNFASAGVAMQQAQSDTPACPSKWVAAGNNGAKADRYFQVSCQ